jgi:hypothetical protein
LKGKIVFQLHDEMNKFDIVENTTEKYDSELKIMLRDDSILNSK